MKNLKIDDQRLYLAGQIATAVYISKATIEKDINVIETNKLIINIADNLLNQLRNDINRS